MAPLGLSFHLLIDDQGLVLSTILLPFDSNQFICCVLGLCRSFKSCALSLSLLLQCHMLWTNQAWVLEATTEARMPRAGAPQQEEPPQWEVRTPQQRAVPLTETRENPHKAIKTQSSQTKRKKKKNYIKNRQLVLQTAGTKGNLACWGLARTRKAIRTGKLESNQENKYLQEVRGLISDELTTNLWKDYN